MRRHVQRYLEGLAAGRGASPHTLRAYGRDLDELCLFLEERGVGEPKGLKPRTMRAFLLRLDERRLARATIQRKLSAARSFFKQLLREGLLEVDPTAGLRQARSRRNLPGSLSVEEVEALLEAPDTTTHAGRRDRALLELCYSAGTRASEAIGIDRGDLDFQRVQDIYD